MGRIEIRKDIAIDAEELLQGLSDMDLDSLEQFSDALNHMIARRKSPNPSDRELKLLDQIYQAFPEADQQRYDALYQKLQAERISEEEHQELLRLVEQAEAHNAYWLQALAELAVLRGVTIQQLKEDLGIENPPLKV